MVSLSNHGRQTPVSAASFSDSLRGYPREGGDEVAFGKHEAK